MNTSICNCFYLFSNSFVSELLTQQIYQERIFINYQRKIKCVTPLNVLSIDHMHDTYIKGINMHNKGSISHCTMAIQLNIGGGGVKSTGV